MMDEMLKDLKEKVSDISKIQDKPVKFLSVKGFTCKLEELKGYKEVEEGKTVVWFAESSVLLNFNFEEFDKAVRALNNG